MSEPITHYDRAWNLLEVYNRLSVVGKIHETFTPSVIEDRRLESVADAYELVQTPSVVFSTTLNHDAAYGAELALRAAKLLTLPVDFLVGTGRVRPVIGLTSEARVKETFWATGDHPTDAGVAGAVVLGLAIGSGVIGGAWGLLEGVPQALVAAFFGWLIERRPPLATMALAYTRTVERRFYQAAVVGAIAQLLALHAVRLVTGLLKVAIAVCGAALGACVGVMHATVAAAYTACFPEPSQPFMVDTCPV